MRKCQRFVANQVAHVAGLAGRTAGIIGGMGRGFRRFSGGGENGIFPLGTVD